MPLVRALSSSPLGEAVDDVAQARVRAHHQAQKTEQHQWHVLSHYHELLRAVRDLPERAGLNDGGERQPQAGQAQSAEQGDEKVQLGDRYCQQDWKVREIGCQYLFAVNN